MKKFLKILVRVWEFVLWLIVVIVVVAQLSDYFRGTDYVEKLSTVPFLWSLVELWGDEFEEVDIDDEYYQQLLSVIDQISAPEDVKNIEVKQLNDHEKMFEISLMNGLTEEVLVVFGSWGFVTKVKR